MANIRISQLPTASSLTGTELVPIVQNGLTSQTTVQAFSATFTFPQTFLTIGAQASLPNSRYIAVSTGLTGADGGIGNAYTLSLSNTGVTAGTYTFPTITINAQGQITSASSNAGEITSISFGTTGLTPNTPTTGSVVVAGTLATTNGGTGLTSLTAGYIPYGAGTSALASVSTFNYNTTNNTLNTPTFGTTSTTSTTPSLSFNAANTSFASGATVASSYLQALMQNKSGTSGASTNYVLSNDLGTDSSYYGEFGMNSSVFSASTPADFFSINNGVYFSGHDGDITVGSGNGFKTYFAWGSSGQSAHVINVSGAIGLNTNLAAGTGSGTTNYGTAGQVLITQGSASAPTWGNVAGGGF